MQSSSIHVVIALYLIAGPTSHLLDLMSSSNIAA